MSRALIRHIVEPPRLILAWQAPDEFNDRTRFAVGELNPRGDDTACLRYFGDSEQFAELNPGKTYDQLKSYGYAGYPGFSTEKAEHDAGVIEAFMRRLPPRSRSDFANYIAHLRIAPDASVTDFSLLGLSEAQLPSDGFSLVDPLSVGIEARELICEVAGYRYYARKPDFIAPPIGARIEICPEPENAFDPNAVACQFGGEKIGNINRLQAATYGTWAKQQRVSAVVDRVNGTEERPRLFLFVEISELPG